MNKTKSNYWDKTFIGLDMNVYLKGKGYFNTNTGKWGFRKILPENIINGQYRRYEFQCFNDEMIYDCFNYEYVEKISYFLTILFCRTMKILKRNGSLSYRNGLKDEWIYFNTNNELRKIFNSNDYIDVIRELQNLNIIQINKKKRNPHDTNKFFNEFRLSKSLITTNKKFKLVKNKKLHNYIKRKNSKVDSINVVSKYEMDCCKLIDIDISKDRLKSIIHNQFIEKKNQSISESTYDFKMKRDRTLIKKRWIDNIIDTEVDYKNILNQTYHSFKYQLESLKCGDIDSNVFWKDEKFGGRYYNIISNLNRCFKSEIILDGESVVELDLRSSQFNSLFYLKHLLITKNSNKFMNYNSILGDILDGIYNNDTNKNTSKVVFGRDWYFEMEDVNYKDNFDFYHYCRFNLLYYFHPFNRRETQRISLNREYIKKLLLYLTFSDDKNKYNRKIHNVSYNKLGEIVFGVEMWEFICTLKHIDLSKHCDKKDYKTYKNTSMILQKLESIIMYFLMNKMMNNNFKFISVFDSFLVKESESDEILKLLNESVVMINPCFRFSKKIKTR